MGKQPAELRDDARGKPYYNPFTALGLDEFRGMLERRVDFEKVEQPEGSYPAPPS